MKHSGEVAMLPDHPQRGHGTRRADSRRATLAWAIGVVLAGAQPAARAEFVVSAFSGLTMTENDDLHLKQAGGTDLTLHGVSYKTRDWESPPYYGGRVAFFLPPQPQWGFGVEFFHAKMYLNTGDSVRVTGTRAGTPVNASEPVGDTIEAFNLSHGLNFLTADAMYRWFLAERDKDFLGRFQPYVGAGIGVAIPHVESTIGGQSFEEYQFHGPAYQAFGGVNFDLTSYLSLFVEYKFSYVDLDSLSVPGGYIGLAPMTHHLVTGLSFRF